MLVNRISRAFSRISRPRLSQYSGVFDLVRDKESEIAAIRNANQTYFSLNKQTTIEKQIQENLSISEKTSVQIAQQTFISTAYSPSLKPYRLKQKLTGKLEVDDDMASLEGRYSPQTPNLRFHYSINQDLPRHPSFKINSSQAYIFNLPDNASEKEIMMELDYKTVKSVQIKYCMMGLPAYALVDFNSENSVTDRIMNQELTITIQDRLCPIVTQIDQNKLQLNRRQLVIQNISDSENPAEILKSLSQFGRVVNLDLPLEIYREQSIKQIKEIYKNELEPVRINFHKQDGTIDSEYYPPYTPPKDLDLLEAKNKQYERRLRYCENIDIYEGKQGEVTVKPRGFCIVTFSCQEEAQNCYFHYRIFKKVALKNDQEDFYFDRKHKEALLRKIDNSYIEQSKKNNPYSNFENFEQKLSNVTTQSFYFNMVYRELKADYYDNATRNLILDEGDNLSYEVYHNYRTGLEKLKNSIGSGVLDQSLVESPPGKSFDELAEEELYGRKLSSERKERYVVNIDDYMREEPEPEDSTANIRKLKKELSGVQSKQKSQTQKIIHDHSGFFDEDQGNSQNRHFDPKKYAGNEEYYEEEGEGEKGQFDDLVDDEDDYDGKRYFSTFSSRTNFVPKTLQQKVRSHMKYNQFVRDTINEYLGVFPADKLEREFGRKSVTFSNPQNLKFIDGSDFLPETDVKKILEFSVEPDQEIYSAFVKGDEIIKSLNIDLESTLLKSLEENYEKSLIYLNDVGMVSEEFEFEGQDIEQAVANLNVNEAEVGYEYQAIINEETGEKKIIKVSKVEPLFPMEAVNRLTTLVDTFQEQEGEEKKLKMMTKYFEDIVSGKPLNKEFLECFDMKEGENIDVSEIFEELASETGISKKDFQKMLNLQNYSDQQLQADLAQQIEMNKIREEKGPKKATDYNRDPSEIKVRGEDGKFVVSKFRQM